MIVWGLPVLGCALLGSALLLRRWPLGALSVMLGGSVASMMLQPVSIVAPIVVACAVGLEICYIAATRSRRVSVTGAAMAAAGLLTPPLAVPSLTALRDGTVGSAGPPAVTMAVPLTGRISNQTGAWFNGPWLCGSRAWSAGFGF